MTRFGRNIDPGSLGPQNRARILEAVSSPIDPRLVDAPRSSSTCEEDVQAASIRALRELGLVVLQASVRYRSHSCPKCGERFYDHQDTGQTPGIPDLLVRRPDWPRALWLGSEQKGDRTRLSPAQRDLHAGGHIVVARCAAANLAFVLETDDLLGGT